MQTDKEVLTTGDFGSQEALFVYNNTLQLETLQTKQQQ